MIPYTRHVSKNPTNMLVRFFNNPFYVLNQPNLHIYFCEKKDNSFLSSFASTARLPANPDGVSSIMGLQKYRCMYLPSICTQANNSRYAYCWRAWVPFVYTVASFVKLVTHALCLYRNFRFPLEDGFWQLTANLNQLHLLTAVNPIWYSKILLLMVWSI